MSTGNTLEPTEALLRWHVIDDLDRIICELEVPMNTGLIAKSIAQHLRSVVAAWPNVTIHDVGQLTELNGA